MKIRKGFVMSVHAGAETEHEKRRNPIWPESEKVLTDHGVLNCSLFLHAETRQLLATPNSKARSSGRPLP
jgi:L-rhamnose mutarotase